VAASSGSVRTAAARKIPEILPSLGASGAIYGAVALTALAFPEAQVSLFIPPSYPISIQWGVGGLLLMDTVGILRGWRCVCLGFSFIRGVYLCERCRFFDHWAHLGGAAFGVAYFIYGPAFWQRARRTFQESET
jgi:rhomboid-like protein